MTGQPFDAICEMILRECATALKTVDPTAVEQYLDLIQKADNVFFVGVGRVMLSLKCIAKRYAHLGIRAVVVGQITEPAITNKDVLIVGSGSGETIFPSAIAKKAKGYGATIIHIGYNPQSGLREITDLFIRIPVAGKYRTEDDVRSVQPMTSLFEQALLLFGDATAMMMIERNRIDMNELWVYHANLE